MKFDSNLHREIWSLGDMTQTLCGNLPEKAAGVFRKEELARFERIVISGCGDSICRLCGKRVFREAVEDGY